LDKKIRFAKKCFYARAQKETGDALNELTRMQQLNLEILEQLEATCKWILEKKVWIPNRDTLISLLRKANTLLDEIYSSPLRMQHPKRTPEDATDPACDVFK